MNMKDELFVLVLAASVLLAAAFAATAAAPPSPITFTQEQEVTIGGLKYKAITTTTLTPLQQPQQEPPKAPTDLTAEVVNKNVVLKWRDNSNNETAFAVWRKIEAPNTEWKRIAALPPDATMHVDVDLPVNTYWYKVRATNNANPGASDWTMIVKAEIKEETSTGPPPTSGSTPVCSYWKVTQEGRERLTPDSKATAGDTISIRCVGGGLGSERGKVWYGEYYDDDGCKIIKWTDTEVIFELPTKVAYLQGIITVTLANGNGWIEKSFRVIGDIL